jgi:hypothetical protein
MEMRLPERIRGSQLRGMRAIDEGAVPGYFTRVMRGMSDLRNGPSEEPVFGSAFVSLFTTL